MACLLNCTKEENEPRRREEREEKIGRRRAQSIAEYFYLRLSALIGVPIALRSLRLGGEI